MATSCGSEQRKDDKTMMCVWSCKVSWKMVRCDTYFHTYSDLASFNSLMTLSNFAAFANRLNLSPESELQLAWLQRRAAVVHASKVHWRFWTLGSLKFERSTSPRSPNLGVFWVGDVLRHSELGFRDGQLCATPCFAASLVGTTGGCFANAMNDTSLEKSTLETVSTHLLSFAWWHSRQIWDWFWASGDRLKAENSPSTAVFCLSLHCVMSSLAIARRRVRPTTSLVLRRAVVSEFHHQTSAYNVIQCQLKGRICLNRNGNSRWHTKWCGAKQPLSLSIYVYIYIYQKH